MTNINLRYLTTHLLLPLLLLLIIIYFSLFFNHNNPFSSPSNSIHHNQNQNTQIPRKNQTKITSLDRIEASLASARAAIRKAIRTKNYTSDKQQSFIPTGSVYRDPYAFHQSYIEMVKRFKIWTYKNGERPMIHTGPTAYLYAIEGHFISELENGLGPFMAQSPDSAHAFFLPVSISLSVHYTYLPDTEYLRGSFLRVFSDYRNAIANYHPYWNRSSGADHFMVSCHDWAPEVSRKNPEVYKNFIRVLCNANMSEGFNPIRDVSLPEFYLQPRKLTPPPFKRSSHDRPILAFFAGGLHGHIREVLLRYWKDKDKLVQVYEYLPKGENYMQLMSKSRFCLCPSGYEVASPRLVESIFVGCVPVIISDNYSLPFGDVLDWSRFSVQIPVGKIPEIKRILQGVSDRKFMKLVRNVVNVRRHFELNRPAKPYDVLHMILHSVWLRRLNVRFSR